jgi:TldD protein
MALATVKWDTEGVVPEPFTLIDHGVLVDFQTTREQAAWLAPYYQQHGRPAQSHGCAVAESAHLIPMQHVPNLTLMPGGDAVRVEDLIADVDHGIFIEQGEIPQLDAQRRMGMIRGQMREITRGRLGLALDGGAVLFDSKKLWKGLTALGGPATQGEVGYSADYSEIDEVNRNGIRDFLLGSKGEPPQRAGYSVQAVAAVLPAQPVIDPFRRG